jgi:hypothetical protein
MMALRKLFRLKSGGGSKSVSSKENSSKRSKKSSTSSSSSSLSSSPSTHNSSSQSTRKCGHSTARNHQIVPTIGQPMSQKSQSPPTQFLASKPCTIRSRRLMKEYHELCRLYHNNENGFLPYSIELVNDTLFEWNIKVYQFDVESQVSERLFKIMRNF